MMNKRQVKVLDNRRMKSAILGPPKKSLLTKLDQLRAEEFRVEKLLSRYSKEADRMEKRRNSTQTLLKKIRINIRRETRVEADSQSSQESD